MSDRDELADHLTSRLGLALSEPLGWIIPASVLAPVINGIASELDEIGYRKPRTITTAEELDALPGSTVVKDCLGQVFEKQEVGQWYDGPHDWLAFDGKFWDVDAIHFPATVLWEPQP